MGGWKILVEVEVDGELPSKVLFAFLAGLVELGRDVLSFGKRGGGLSFKVKAIRLRGVDNMNVKKVVVMVLDYDGLEAYRKEYSINEVWKTKYADVVRDMIREGVRVRQVGEEIVLLY